MRDRSKKLLVINTGKKESEQTRLPAQSGTTHIIGGGGMSVNMADYLLKSIWDKVFEIRTDSQGTEYIFGKLPVVTQYGITMYSGDGVDVPSLASGLPFDGRTIWYNPDTQQIEVIGGTGGGSGEGVSYFWDLSGIPSWITNSKPKYTYSEIEGTPDLTKYALVSQIPSLSGYATESWVLQKNYATKATTLSGYGITDAYTKTNVDDLLKAYVTLSGSQTITGEKNFTGGLKVNGSPIVYDTEKKYWKLEGDLLVTGGVTMYGNDSSFTPSTIMDALLYDDATLGINSNGQLYVKGGASGGGLDITALQNYLTSNSYLNVTSGDNRYLKLSGGMINGENDQVPLAISNTASTLRIGFVRNNEVLGYFGFIEANKPLFYDKDGNGRLLLHERNYSQYALPLSGGTIDSHFGAFSIKRNEPWASAIKFENTSGVLGYIGYNDDYTVQIWDKNQENSKYILHSGNYSSFALPLSGGTINGDLFIANSYGGLVFSNTSNNSNAFLFYNGNADWYVTNKDWGAGYKIWHEGNDGSGSGLDADLLDGQHGSWYQGNIHSFERVGYTSSLVHDANVAINGMLYNYGSNTYWRNTPDMSYGQILTLKSYGSNELMGQLAWDIRHGEIDTTRCLWWRAIQNESTISNAKWHQIAFTDSNVASATKLQTARTIWGQSFDGTGNVDDTIRMLHDVTSLFTEDIICSLLAYSVSPYGLIIRARNNGNVSLQVQRESNENETFPLILNPNGGNVGIGTPSPSAKLHVSGDILATGGITMYSMRALKNVVDERGLSLSELSAIKPTRYTWKDGRDNRLHFGGIADDIQQVLPEVVYSTSNGILTMDYGNAAFAVASSLIQPVVDHEKRIAMLEEENKQLRLEVERLKSA